MVEIDKKLAIPQGMCRSLIQIVERFAEKGHQCYLVGGSVRDLVLNSEAFDYDLATDARPADMMKLFRKVIPTGIKHGTVSVILNKKSFEITTYRSDGKYVDGRHPEKVTFSDTLEQDVQRRDFTINGLAYDLVHQKIIDYVSGYADLEKKIIRTIGDPMERFTEDGLRPLRACRFAAKLNFAIEEETLEAISRTLHVTAKVSAERVRDEILKLMETPKPSVGFEHMRRTGLLSLVLPELDASFNVSQNRFHRYDIYYHSVLSCDAAPQDRPIIRLAALLHDIGKVPSRRPGPNGDNTFYNHEIIGAKMARKIMKRLKFSNEQTEKVTNLITNHMFHYTDEWTDGAVRRFIRKVGLDAIDDLITLRLADRKGNGARSGLPAPIGTLMTKIREVIEADNAFTVRDLDINGNVIMETFNLQPGPIIGTVLNELLEMVLDNPDLNRRDLLLDKAGEIIDRQPIQSRATPD